MSPKEKHVPADAHRTSVCFTAEDRAAIRWISEARRYRKSKRITINDIIVDALWDFLEKTEGKTREQDSRNHAASASERSRTTKCYANA